MMLLLLMLCYLLNESHCNQACVPEISYNLSLNKTKVYNLKLIPILVIYLIRMLLVYRVVY